MTYQISAAQADKPVSLTGKGSPTSTGVTDGDAGPPGEETIR